MPSLDRGIQYAAASRLNHNRLWIVGCPPVKPGDDSGVFWVTHPNSVSASSFTFRTTMTPATIHAIAATDTGIAN